MEDAGIVKSPNDKKLYRRVVLQNGLVCLLIHDPEMYEGGMRSDGQQDHDGTEASSSVSVDTDEREEDEDEEDDDPSDGNSLEDDSPGSDASSAGEMDNGGEPRGHVKKAAAAMAVGVGSFSDPNELPGLSHYLEHMLFMGSKKYPDENEYEAYLTKHGGFSNAFTELEYTVFHFDVKPEALHGALDRFAQFFVAPLCKEDALEREVMAVDSEFSMSLHDDDCRLFQLMCHTAKPGHVYQKFTWGNKASLWDDPQKKGLNVREELIKFYSGQYGAERMSLVVLGGETLDELQTWVQEMFSIVPGGVGASLNFKENGLPFSGQTLYIVPTVKELHQVSVSFQLPCLQKEYKKKAEDYISHLVGHEGPGSLLSALKSRGWAVECAAGVEDSCFSMNSCVYVFGIDITLTEAGLMASPGFGLAPVLLLFQYLKMIRDAEPQSWVFDELKAIGEMKFRFQEEGDAANYVTRLSTAMFYYEPQHVIQASYLYQQWDPDLVAELMSKMVPDAPGLRIDLQTKWSEKLLEGAKSHFGDVHLEHEPWFDFDYVAIALSNELKSAWKDAQVPPDLALPPRNPYLPENFDIKHNAIPNDLEAGAVEEVKNGSVAIDMTAEMTPNIICDEPGLRVWHKLDKVYKTPKTNIFIRLASPFAYGSPRDAALLQMMLELWEEVLNEEAYLADVAGLYYGTSVEALMGVEVRVSGFSDKLPLLTNSIFKTIADFKVEPAMFSRTHEIVLRKFQNMNMKVSKHSFYLRVFFLSPFSWHADDIHAELAKITAQDVEQYVAKFLSKVHLEILVQGNTTESEALELARDVRKILGPGILSASDRRQSQCTRLNDRTSYIHRVPAKNSDEENSALELYFQFEPTNNRDKAMVDIVDQMSSEPCFNILRTQEQLGYTVHSSAKLTHGVLGLSFSIVSEKYAPAYLEERVDAFLHQFEQMLTGMSDEEFEHHREALIADNLQKEHNLEQASSRVWEHIMCQRYQFSMRKEQVEILQQISKKEVQDWYSKHISPASSARKQLSVHVIGKNGQDPPHSTIGNQSISRPLVQIDDLKSFRSTLPVYPCVVRDIGSLVDGKKVQRSFKGGFPYLGSLGRSLRFR